MIEVLPPLLMLAQRVEEEARTEVEAWAWARRRQARGESQEGGPVQCERMVMPDVGVVEEVVERLLEPPWPVQLTLPLLNTCTEIGGLLEAEAWVQVRGKVRESGPRLLASDLPGVMRQCLLLAESRGDETQAWIALLRELYHLVPPESAATTELVLEQCIKQSPSCVELLVQDLESRLQGPLSPSFDTVTSSGTTKPG